MSQPSPSQRLDNADTTSATAAASNVMINSPLHAALNVLALTRIPTCADSVSNNNNNNNNNEDDGEDDDDYSYNNNSINHYRNSNNRRTFLLKADLAWLSTCYTALSTAAEDLHKLVPLFVDNHRRVVAMSRNTREPRHEENLSNDAIDAIHDRLSSHQATKSETAGNIKDRTVFNLRVPIEEHIANIMQWRTSVGARLVGLPCVDSVDFGPTTKRRFIIDEMTHRLSLSCEPADGMDNSRAIVARQMAERMMIKDQSGLVRRVARGVSVSSAAYTQNGQLDILEKRMATIVRDYIVKKVCQRRKLYDPFVQHEYDESDEIADALNGWTNVDEIINDLLSPEWAELHLMYLALELQWIAVVKDEERF